MTKSSIFNEILKSIPLQTTKFVEHSMDIAYLLRRHRDKRNMTDADLAKKIGLKAKDIKRWLSGNNNFTLMQVSLIEAKLGIQLMKFLAIGCRKKKM